MNHVEISPDKPGAIVVSQIACTCNASDCSECVARCNAAVAVSVKANPAPPAVDERTRLEKKIDTLTTAILDMHDSLATSEGKIAALEAHTGIVATPTTGTTGG